MTRDTAAAKKFYSDLFGWTWMEMDMGEHGTYHMHTPPGAERPVGGMMEMAGPQFEGIPPHWMNYIAVDDINASTAKAKDLGATVLVEPTPIPNVGFFSVIQDPTGATISMFQTQ
jgi:predicted enzyme related to lactoylglutathione lyase